MKKIETDVAVVGAGLAGLSAADQAAAAGEKENYMAFPGSTLPGVMGRVRRRPWRTSTACCRTSAS